MEYVRDLLPSQSRDIPRQTPACLDASLTGLPVEPSRTLGGRIADRRIARGALGRHAGEHRDVAVDLSPMGWAHVSLTGDYLWTDAAAAGGFRPLNDPADRLYRAA